MAEAAAPAGDVANVSVNWNLFQSIFSAIDNPLTESVDSVVSALLGYVHPILMLVLTAYLIFVGLQMAFAPSGNPLGTFISQAVRGAVVVALLGNIGTFNQYAGDIFLRTIPNEIGNALNGPIGGGAPISGGTQFDYVWNHAYAAGLAVYKNLPWSGKGLVLGIAVAVYWAAAIAAVVVAFRWFLQSHVTVALVVAVGPLFIACAIVPATRSYFSGWLSTLVSAVTTQVLVVALMTLMIRIEDLELARIVAAPEGANVIGQLGSLLGVGGLLAMCALLAGEIPNIAGSITGGAHQHFGSYFGGAARVVSGVSVAASAAAGALVGSSAGSRPAPVPAGRSLSGSMP